MFSKGLLYVVFGSEYDKFAAKCLAYSRKFTSVPICVLTNIDKNNRSKDWPSDIIFKYFNLPQKDNRRIKTSMVHYTPFEKTIYVDSDTIITRHGIDSLLDNKHLIQKDKITLLVHKVRTLKDTNNIYNDHMKLTGANYPLIDFYGAIIGFTKSEKLFFNTWHNYWKLTGSGREMPALACTVQNLHQPINLFPGSTFAWKPDKYCLIQHEYRDWLKKKFNCTNFVPFKPFDIDRKRDWAKLSFDLCDGSI